MKKFIYCFLVVEIALAMQPKLKKNFKLSSFFQTLQIYNSG